MKEAALAIIAEINDQEKNSLIFPATNEKENPFLNSRKYNCGLLDTADGQILLPDVTQGVGRAVTSIGSAQLRGADLLLALDGFLPNFVDLPEQGEVNGSFSICETVEGFYKLADLAGVWPINFPRPSSIAKAIERGSKTAARSFRYIHDSYQDGKIAGQPVIGLFADADKSAAVEFWTFKKGKKDDVSIFSAPASYILGIAALEAAWRRQKPKKQQEKPLLNENGQPVDADGNLLIDEKLQALNTADADLLLAAVDAAKAELDKVKLDNKKLKRRLADVKDMLCAVEQGRANIADVISTLS